MCLSAPACGGGVGLGVLCESFFIGFLLSYPRLGLVCVFISTCQWVGCGPGSTLRVILDWEWSVCLLEPASGLGVGLGAF